MSIGQLQRARQAASCLPAALKKAWAIAQVDDDAVELTDILPTDSEGVGPAEKIPPPPPPRFSGFDSKFAKLLELLRFEVRGERTIRVLAPLRRHAEHVGEE